MNLKILGLAGFWTVALTMAFSVSSASATTLEIGGEAKNEAVTFTVSLKTGTSSFTSRTDGTFMNTCLKGHMHGTTQTPFTAPTVTAPITGVSAEECQRPVVVHKPGQLYVEYTSETNGAVYWENGEATIGSPFGAIICKSVAATPVGTLTGTASGHATIHINGVVTCGFVAPSVKWTATFTVTTPTGVGVSE